VLFAEMYMNKLCIELSSDKPAMSS